MLGRGLCGQESGHPSVGRSCGKELGVGSSMVLALRGMGELQRE